jgi:hypothetical protein
VGEFTTDLIDGFDPRDLDWFAKYLSNGGKWTEAALEHLPLPYSGARLGKAEPSTPYSRLVGRCVDRGIIGDRGGPGNKPGILLVKDEKEIARLLRTAPPA